MWNVMHARKNKNEISNETDDGRIVARYLYAVIICFLSRVLR